MKHLIYAILFISSVTLGAPKKEEPLKERVKKLEAEVLELSVQVELIDRFLFEMDREIKQCNGSKK
jgi:hypothetical protein